MAATLRVPFARLDPWPSALAVLRAHGFALVALTPRDPAEDLEAFASRPRGAKLALMIGNEGAGLTPAAEATADYRGRIPIRSGVDSLNLAVAAGIAMYRLTSTNA
jgi:tRNA G18 (ribose-2'-O)-methylase SpoU